jgi:hypothetical protein
MLEDVSSSSASQPGQQCDLPLGLKAASKRALLDINTPSFIIGYPDARN